PISARFRPRAWRRSRRVRPPRPRPPSSRRCRDRCRASVSRWPQIDGPDQPLAIADWLALDEEGLAVDLDTVAGARVRHLGDSQVDPGGLGPEPRIAEGCDDIRATGDHPHQNGRAAVGYVDRVPADVRIGEESANGGGEGAHQKAAFRRTRPMVSPAPLATASTATPMRVLSVATVVQRLLVSSQWTLAPTVQAWEPTLVMSKTPTSAVSTGSPRAAAPAAMPKMEPTSRPSPEATA